jgi:hypothetical protein
VSNEYLILYEYLDELLRVQSKAADMFEHSGVLGTVRENFLTQQIKERIDNPLIHTGQVVSNGHNVGQADLIIRKRGTINPELGGQVRIPSVDCEVVIEVKSNARGTDFRDFNIKAQKMKEENPNLKCGFFGYKLDCRKSTILRRFGVSYDLEYLDFEHDQNLVLQYPNIDFVVCIDDNIEEVIRRGKIYDYNKFFFLSKNLEGLNKYDLILSPPFSEYFLSQIKVL